MDWDAFGAVATAAASLVALGFGVSAEVRARRAEKELAIERHERSRAEEQSQARRVAAWIVAERTDVAMLSGERLAGILDVFVEVQNASEEPVWNVRVELPTVHHDGDDLEVLTFEIVPPTTTVRRKVGWTPPDDYAPVPMRFRDNRGREWARSRDAGAGIVQIG